MRRREWSRGVELLDGEVLFAVHAAIRETSPWQSRLGGGFRHHADLLREGDEARVVLIGARERVV
jgi:hypothetical protein